MAKKLGSGPAPEPGAEPISVRALSPRLKEVRISPLPLDRFALVMRRDRYRAFRRAFDLAGEILAGRVVWNINSTAHGGGVAEMLRSLLAYERGAGVDARWLVIEGSPPFFAVTKRIHNRLHGFPGDGGALGAEEQAVYSSLLTEAAGALARMIDPRDVVILHDPQTAALCGPMSELGATVIWRSHIGLDLPNDLARSAWDFLRPHVLPADAYVFSRGAYVWEGMDPDRAHVIPPVIDAFSPKNQDLHEDQVESILATCGLIRAEPEGTPSFLRENGSPGLVSRQVSFADGGPGPPEDEGLVVQVSRWDRLKDPVGVIRGFAQHVAPRSGGHLIVAGPSVEAVSDDPEGAGVLAEARAEWGGLGEHVRSRIHLACLPMDDTEENAAIVNALQRRAAVVVQKSLAEGFGLTVAEAMWKARPVVASRIGGIQDQIVDGVTGVLVDPADPGSFGRAVVDLLGDAPRAALMGERARRRVRDEYLGPRLLRQSLRLIEGILRKKRGTRRGAGT